MARLLLKLLFTSFLLSLSVPYARAAGWVKGKLKTMSLDEKIGQLFIVSVKGTTVTEETKSFLDAGKFGGIILFSENLESVDQTKALIKALQTHTIVKTGVPLVMSVDQEGGLVNRLQEVTYYKSMRHSARTIGRLYAYAPDRAQVLVQKVTDKIAEQMKDLGFNMNMAPVLDMTDDKEAYIFSRSYGNDPELVSAITSSYIRSMTKQGIASTGKHFPNLGQTIIDTHKDLPTLNRSLRELRKHEFVPFKEHSKQLGAIMVGHVLVPAIDPKRPTSLSPRAMRIIRKDLGFRGVIVSDDLKMGALSKHYSHEQILVEAVRAGNDMLIMAWDEDKQRAAPGIIKQAIKDGRLSQRALNRSVRRILKLKQRFAREVP